MRSIKPGRGSSLQGAIGSLFAVVFGIVWMVSAAKSGAPTPFVLMLSLIHISEPTRP